MKKKHFNPGDKVRIVSSEAPVVEEKGFKSLNDKIGLFQELHVNDIVTIDEYNAKGDYYKIKEDDGFFMWMPNWLGPCTSKLKDFISSLQEEPPEK